MKQIITLLALFFIILRVEGQSLSPHVIAAIGGFSSADDISLNWTVGETFTATHTTGDFYLTQGFQQPGFMIVSAELTTLPDFEIRLYPNPATDFIRVEWTSDIRSEVHVELYDLLGRRISHLKSDNNSSHIRVNMQSLQRSAYLLRVYSGDGEFSKTFRIIKY